MNQAILSTRIYSKEEFAELEFGFKSKSHPVTRRQIEFKLRIRNFSEVTGEDGKSLAKFIVSRAIEQS